MIDMAYVAVIETRDGQSGYYLGLAVENERGYNQLAPGYGPYRSYADASEHARELNTRLGHNENSAARIICSTMRRA